MALYLTILPVVVLCICGFYGFVIYSGYVATRHKRDVNVASLTGLTAALSHRLMSNGVAGERQILVCLLLLEYKGVIRFYRCDNAFCITQTSRAVELTSTESSFVNALFSEGETVELEGGYVSAVASANAILEKENLHESQAYFSFRHVFAELGGRLPYILFFAAFILMLASSGFAAAMGVFLFGGLISVS